MKYGALGEVGRWRVLQSREGLLGWGSLLLMHERAGSRCSKICTASLPDCTVRLLLLLLMLPLQPASAAAFKAHLPSILFHAKASSFVLLLTAVLLAV